MFTPRLGNCEAHRAIKRLITDQDAAFTRSIRVRNAVGGIEASVFGILGRGDTVVIGLILNRNIQLNYQ